jgi:manganese/zinc/iron transport system substrate-binding protein
MSKKFLAVVIPLGFLAISVLGFAACSPSKTDGPPSGKVRIVATTGLVADLARRVGGDAVVVTALMGPGVDPHLYKASEGDVRRLSEADLILYNGLHLEGKMGDILEKMARTRPVVAIGTAIPEATLRRPSEFEGLPDPHVWFDVSLWAECVGPIAEALATLRPKETAAFQARAETTKKELLALDAWVQEKMATLPPERRVVVTAHDAFGYFGRRYGVEVFGIQGISTLSEAGLKDVERIVDLVAERRVPAIFVESSVPRRTVEAVQAGVRSRGHEVAIGGQLYSDSLGGAETPQGTYDGMVRANVDTLVAALGVGGTVEAPK